jgi:hypothetical protein
MLAALTGTTWSLGIGIAVFALLSGFASVFLLLLHWLNGKHCNCAYPSRPHCRSV